MAAASREAAEINRDLGLKQLEWAREQYGMDREVTDLVIETALARQEEFDGYAREDRERYKEVFQPVENELVEDAKTYNSEARREGEAGKAAAGVSQEFAMARTAAADRLESFGIDPSQVRAGALDVQTRTQEAAARASAANQARERVENTGRALRADVVNLGKGYPSQSAQAAGVAMNSGNQAVNSGIATTATGAQAMGNPSSYMGNSINAVNGWWNGASNMYATQMKGWQTEQSQSSGIGSALGSIAGIGANMFMMSDERVKEDVKEVGTTHDGQPIYSYEYKGDPKNQTHMGLMAQDVEKRDPGAVAENREGIKHVNYDRALKRSAIPHYEHGGVAIDPSLSPSGGQAVDDVPARVNVGEFIVPRDAVSWYGEKHFQSLIQKARAEKEGAAAKPSYGPALNEEPAVRTALPTR
jgi:hypothetical protein